MVLGSLEILLEVLEWFAVSVVSEEFVGLKAGLLGLILFVLCFPKVVILWLVVTEQCVNAYYMVMTNVSK